MPLYTFLHNLLNVLVQTGNRLRLQKKTFSDTGRNSVCMCEVTFVFRCHGNGR
jgi:hypothetical protein